MLEALGEECLGSSEVDDENNNTYAYELGNKESRIQLTYRFSAEQRNSNLKKGVEKVYHSLYRARRRATLDG